MTSTTAPLHERLQFDLPNGQVQDGPRRYVIMRADVLMGAFDGLAPGAREDALRALGRSVTGFGSDSVRAYLAEVGLSALLETMQQSSASLGWGRWSFRLQHERLELTVANSPFAAGTRATQGRACHAIAGMLEAVAGALWSAPVRAQELRCACEDPAGQGECSFVAVPATVG
jgi:predicted hydrocarbon binding protein